MDDDRRVRVMVMMHDHHMMVMVVMMHDRHVVVVMMMTQLHGNLGDLFGRPLRELRVVRL
ncbi:MAG: hypothetical protein WBB34_06425 [Xanthobacteraceae bacterium]